MMRNPITTLLLSAALTLGTACVAVAHDDGYEDERDALDWQHREGHALLERRHDAVHERIAAEHYAAHAYNPYMTRSEHRRLHEQLAREHAWRDNRLMYQHGELHRDLNDEYRAYRDRDYYYAPRWWWR